MTRTKQKKKLQLKLCITSVISKRKNTDETMRNEGQKNLADNQQ